VIDAHVHSPSPISWSPDGRFIVFSRIVDDLDQVFIAAADGSMRQQVTTGTLSNWGPALSPDGRTIVFATGDPVVALSVIQIDGTGERKITAAWIDAFDLAEWSPDATTLLFAAGTNFDETDLWVV